MAQLQRNAVMWQSYSGPHKLILETQHACPHERPTHCIPVLIHCTSIKAMIWTPSAQRKCPMKLFPNTGLKTRLVRD